MQKTTLLSAACALALTSFVTVSPVAAKVMSFTDEAPAMVFGVTEIERRGRGGRSKPRVPGGSGCDDPEDLIEHPECTP